jgi:hypothetical protein
MPLDRPVVAQEPDRGVLGGGQLGQHDQVLDPGLGGQVGEAPLLGLRPLGRRRDQVGPLRAGERRGDGGRVVKVGDGYRRPGRQPGAVAWPRTMARTVAISPSLTCLSSSSFC